MKGFVHSFESFGTVDGPGIRFVVFMQGCPMRCLYCHNPDTWTVGKGKEYTPEEVAYKVLKYKSYFSNGGGVTVSGGEPLLQIDFVTELFRLLSARGVNCALDTSGITFNPENDEILQKFDELIKYVDLVLLDIKHIDDESHRNLTGHGNKNPLAFAEYLSDRGIKIWIRHVLVPGITDDDKWLTKLKSFIDGLKTVEKVEVLPYHTMGKVKYEKLGLEYALGNTQPPAKERVLNAKRILNDSSRRT